MFAVLILALAIGFLLSPLASLPGIAWCCGLYGILVCNAIVLYDSQADPENSFLPP